ncbi:MULTISPECIES: hypothetical protein [unclassified Helicobacter]|uniref:hypothetical protein n=1 Tax=unclassified Helicobacter TaxID=2593540 RepID=UPI001F1855DA|nr:MULTISPECIES: hypothetical protein [unclassified Helicobacter]
MWSAVGIVMTKFIQGLFIELRATFQNRGNESLKEIFHRFRERMSAIIKDIKAKWKEIFTGSIEAGVMAFLSNIVVFAINIFATTLKKMTAIIRAGFVSLCQAIKTIINPPEGLSKDDAYYEALKIITAGLIGAIFLGFSEVVKGFITTSLPLLIPFADPLSVTLTALAGGLLTTIAIYFMDKLRSEGKIANLQIKMMGQSGLIRDYRIAQTLIVFDDAIEHVQSVTIKSVQHFSYSVQRMDSSLQNLKDSHADADEVLARNNELLKNLNTK